MIQKFYFQFHKKHTYTYDVQNMSTTWLKTCLDMILSDSFHTAKAVTGSYE